MRLVYNLERNVNTLKCQEAGFYEVDVVPSLGLIPPKIAKPWIRV